MNVRRILIVDDHPLLREGLKAIIRRSPSFEVIGEAGNGRQALRLAVELEPDLILIDISLPDQSGIVLTKELKGLLPDSIVLIISVHSGANYISDSFSSGAAGYLVKEAVPETLLHAMDVVSNGGYYFDGPASPKMIEKLKCFSLNETTPDESRYSALTRRQREVLVLLAKGLSCRAVADRLCISPRTVENHRAAILERLQLSNTVGLVIWAARQGLLEPHG
jgi:DNA-binding NarL/FixJ family response regulator